VVEQGSFATASQKGPVLGAAISGAINGLMPCSMTMAMAVKATTAPSPPEGMLLMLAFGAGTLPSMLFASVLFGKLGPRCAAACRSSPRCSSSRSVCRRCGRACASISSCTSWWPERKGAVPAPRRHCLGRVLIDSAGCVVAKSAGCQDLPMSHRRSSTVIPRLVALLMIATLSAAPALATDVTFASGYRPTLTPELKARLAQADVAAGEKYFERRCSQCHDGEKTGGHAKGPFPWTDAKP
jgi:hypothetical protein